MKHATAESTEPLNEIEDATGRARADGADGADGELGPPKKRSAAAKATSGVEVRADRDDDVVLVDERDLLDEIGFALEQATVDRRREHGDAKIAPQRPKAPDLLDKGIRSESPAVEALTRIEARTPSVPPRPAKISSVPPPIPAQDEVGSASLLPSPVAPHEAMTLRLPSTPPPGMAEPGDATPSLTEIANAAPVKHLPPPPRPLPPVPVPPASLRAHLANEPPVTVRERRRRKPIDRPVVLPAYTPGAVTIRSQRPTLPPAKHATKSSSKGGLSWGWAAAIILVGAGAYAAGTSGARDERGAPRSAAVTQIEARPSTPAAENDEVSTTSRETIAPTESVASEAKPDVAPSEAPAPVEPKRDAVKAPEPARAIHASGIGASFARPEPEASPVAAPAPTRGLDASAVSSTLARAGAKAVSCTDPRGGEGTVNVTFLPSGNPVNVKMNGPYDGTAVANCVEQIFRATRVAPFEGAATTVYYTVRLPGDGKPIN